MFPALHTVEHRTQVVVGENALGQAQFDVVSRERKVTGIRPRSTTDGNEAALAGRVATEVSMTTPDADWADGDVVVIPGRGEFIVRGDVEDFTTFHPFGPGLFGYRVTLRRVHVEPS